MLAYFVIALPLTVWWIIRIINRMILKVVYAYLLLPLGLLSLSLNQLLSEDKAGGTGLGVLLCHQNATG